MSSVTEHRQQVTAAHKKPKSEQLLSLPATDVPSDAFPSAPSIPNVNAHSDVRNESTPPTVGKGVTAPGASSVPSSALLRGMTGVLAGAGAGAVSTVACSPLDVIKVRQQVQPLGYNSRPDPLHTTLLRTVKQDGVKGLFRGIVPSLFTIPLFWGIYFPTYNGFKSLLHEQVHMDPDGAAHHCLAAISAGLVSDVATNPLWVVRTRMISDIYHTKEMSQLRQMGTFQLLARVARTEGVFALYKGLSASVLGLSHVAIQFPLYECLKRKSRQHDIRGIESVAGLIMASSVSKLVASTITYPHEVLRAQMQDSRGAVSVPTTFRRILAEEGVRGLYRGLSLNLVRVVPSCTVTFLAYELLHKHIGQLLTEAEVVWS